MNGIRWIFLGILTQWAKGGNWPKLLFLRQQRKTIESIVKMLLISNLKTVCKYLFSFAFGKGSKFADYLPIRGHLRAAFSKAVLFLKFSKKKLFYISPFPLHLQKQKCFILHLKAFLKPYSNFKYGFHLSQFKKSNPYLTSFEDF